MIKESHFSHPKRRAWRIAAERRAQIKYVLKVFLLAFFALPLVGIAFVIVSQSIFLFFIIPVILVVFIWIKAILSEESFLNTLLDNITIFPAQYAEGELKLERQLRATHVLILINAAIHYTLVILGESCQETIREYFMFLPEKMYLWNLLISPLTSMFLHADADHLWWNMIFLWAFGLVLERRIGWRQFILLYFLTGIISSLISVVIPIIFLQEFSYELGASGAISGIIGVFAVRLYSKRLVFPIPILGFFSFIIPVKLKVRVNSLFVIGMYFWRNLRGGIFTLLGEAGDIGYWAHIGGMISGIILGLRLGYQDRAAEDRYTEQGLAALENENKVAQRCLLRALELNPENEDALLALARRKSWLRPSEEGRMLYERLIRLTLEKAPERAAAVFIEYFPIYRVSFEPATQYRLAKLLKRYGWSDVAARALEALIDDPATPPRWVERSLFDLARILEELRLSEAARFRYEQLLERFPDFPDREHVQYKIRMLSCA